MFEVTSFALLYDQIRVGSKDSWTLEKRKKALSSGRSIASVLNHTTFEAEYIITDKINIQQLTRGEGQQSCTR